VSEADGPVGCLESLGEFGSGGTEQPTSTTSSAVVITVVSRKNSSGVGRPINLLGDFITFTSIT
jgi:hypothetical protein